MFATKHYDQNNIEHSIYLLFSRLLYPSNVVAAVKSPDKYVTCTYKTNDNSCSSASNSLILNKAICNVEKMNNVRETFETLTSKHKTFI